MIEEIDRLVSGSDDRNNLPEDFNMLISKVNEIIQILNERGKIIERK